MIKVFSKLQIEKGRKTFYKQTAWPFIWPVSGAQIANGFGYYKWRGRWHYGLDIGDWNNYKTPILAASNGKVVYAGCLNSGFGNLVVIRAGNNNGYMIETAYAHLYQIKVKKGQDVVKGQVIGLMGGNPADGITAGNTTAPHLHFEMRLRKIYPLGVLGDYFCIEPTPQLPQMIKTKYGYLTCPQYNEHNQLNTALNKSNLFVVESEQWLAKNLSSFII